MKKQIKRFVCLLLVLLLAAAALTGCAQNEKTTEAPAPNITAAAQPAEGEKQELGEGSKLFYFDVTFSNGETSSYAIHTDADTVGEALVGLDLIAGDESEYGLYVKTVDGETADDGAQEWWCLTKNGEMSMTGVDETMIADGEQYEFTFTVGW